MEEEKERPRLRNQNKERKPMFVFEGFVSIWVAYKDDSDSRIGKENQKVSRK